MVINVKNLMCLVCEETDQEGIIILGSFICSDCEKRIVETSVDHEDYYGYLSKLKKIWALALSN